MLLKTLFLIFLLLPSLSWAKDNQCPQLFEAKRALEAKDPDRANQLLVTCLSKGSQNLDYQESLELLYALWAHRGQHFQALGALRELITLQGGGPILALKSPMALEFYLRKSKQKYSATAKAKMAEWFYELSILHLSVMDTKMKDGRFEDVRHHAQQVTKDLAIAKQWGADPQKIFKAAQTLKNLLQRNLELAHRAKLGSIRLASKSQDLIEAKEDQAEKKYFEEERKQQEEALGRNHHRLSRKGRARRFHPILALSAQIWGEDLVANRGTFQSTIGASVWAVSGGVGVENQYEDVSLELKAYYLGGRAEFSGTDRSRYLQDSRTRVSGVLGLVSVWSRLPSWIPDEVTVGAEVGLFYRKLEVLTQINATLGRDSTGSPLGNLAVRFEQQNVQLKLKAGFSPLYSGVAPQIEFGLRL